MASLLKRLVPVKVMQSRLNRRAYMQFAERIGLVYFGYVNQRHDEHQPVRGLTASASHRDNHYSIGAFQGYDVALVERTDTIRRPKKKPVSYEWVVMTFKLHRPVDLPHVFVGLHTHGDTFYSQFFTKFANFRAIRANPTTGYGQAFSDKYSIYAKPSQVLSSTRLFNPEIAAVIAERFDDLTIELWDNYLYIYSQHTKPSAELLDKMLTYGAWLARVLDENVDV